MSPPVVVIVVASVAAGAAVGYAVKEAWEPHIKPELQKASTAVKAWMNKKERFAVTNGPAFLRRHRRLSDTNNDEGVGSQPKDDISMLERLVDRALDINSSENQLRVRAAAGKTDVYDSDIFPSSSDEFADDTRSQRSRRSTTLLADTQPPSHSTTVVQDLISQPSRSLTERSLADLNHGLQLSFPSVSSSSSAAVSYPFLPSSDTAHMSSTQPQVALPHDANSPWSNFSSLSPRASSVSAFSWTEASGGEGDDVMSVGTMSLDGEDSEHAPAESPLYHSLIGSDLGAATGLHGSASESGWESVGSPRSSVNGRLA